MLRIHLPFTNYLLLVNYHFPFTKQSYKWLNVKLLKIENCELLIGATGGSDLC